MVTVEEMVEEPKPWEERLLDAEEIEQAAAALKRPTARMHLESLAKKLRKESDALKRVDRSQQQSVEEKKEEGEKSAENATSRAESAAPGPSTSNNSTQEPTVTEDTKVPAAVPAAAAPPVPSSVMYVPIDRFAFDAGGYNAPFVTLYIDLPSVGSIPRENVECNFTKDSFDLIVKDLRGKSYRLFKDMLEKDIDPDKSKIVVKADKILVKLAKIKTSEYGGFDFWSKLTDPKKKEKDKDDPSKSIMGLMKQMYDEGDDQMKKMIGETVMKQRTGELGKGSDDFMKDDF